MKVVHEDQNHKAVRYSVLTLAVLSTGLCLFSIPKKGNINEVRDEVRVTQVKLNKAKKQAAESSPLNNRNDFDLVKSEQTASNELTKEMSLAFGNLHNEKEYDAQNKNFEKFFGKKFTTLYCAYTPDMIKNNFTKVYFGQVTDIHHAPVFVYVEYQAKDRGKDHPYSTAFEFDYDLTKQKVNDFRQKDYMSSNVLADRGSNL